MGRPKTAAPKPRKVGRPSTLEKVHSAAALLKQVSDPTRLQLLLTLKRGQHNVTKLCDFVGQSQPAVSHHLALLRHSGLVTPTRNGKESIYSLTKSGEALTAVASTVVG
jgi:DNA-binding transcriptional ArsR family regulator